MNNEIQAKSYPHIEATRSIPKNFVFSLTDRALRTKEIDVVGSEKRRRGLFPLPSFFAHGTGSDGPSQSPSRNPTALDRRVRSQRKSTSGQS